MGQKYALLIGNTNYKNLPTLTTPDDDVKNLTRVLREPKIDGFNQVTPLVDRPINEIMLEVSKLFKDRKPDDLVMQYFSGHGVMDHDRNSLYLATHDTDSELLRATAIPSSFIQDEMDNCGSRQVVLILDCCYSGVLASGAKGALDDTVGTANHFKGNGRGKIILTASDKRKVAWEGNRVIGGIENSLYTHFLIQGLESGEADVDQDDQVSVEELHRYTARKLAETGKQTPLMKKWDDDTSEIIIARNPVVKPIPLPAYLQTMIQSSDKDLRVAAVHELDRLLSSRPEEGWAKSALAALQQLAKDDSRSVSDEAKIGLGKYDRTSPPPQPSSRDRQSRMQQQVPQTIREIQASQPVQRVEPLQPEPKTRAVQSPQSISTGRIIALTVLLTVVFWIVSFVAISVIDSALVDLIIGGLAVAAILRLQAKSLGMGRVIAVAAGWPIGGFFGYSLVIGGAVASAFDVGGSSSTLIPIGLLIPTLVGGALMRWLLR